MLMRFVIPSLSTHWRGGQPAIHVLSYLRQLGSFLQIKQRVEVLKRDCIFDFFVSVCPVQLRTRPTIAFWRYLSYVRSLVQSFGSYPVSVALWFCAMPTYRRVKNKLSRKASDKTAFSNKVLYRHQITSNNLQITTCKYSV